MGVSKVLGIIPMEERVVSSDITRYKMVKKNWFAYNPMRLNIGSIARWHGDEDILVSPDYVVFRCVDEPESGISPDYLDQFRQSALWDAFVSEGGDGGVRIRIYYQDLAQLKISLPTPAEQQKIADCLTSLDELIASQRKKVKALKSYKRGLMQQLFPREGEALPQFRFPEFRTQPEWDTLRIAELKPFVTSGSRGWAAYYANHGSLFVRITNLSRDSISLDLTDSKFVNLPSGSSEGVRTQLRTHDILISITADIGIVGYVDDSFPAPAYINQHIALVRFENANVCSKFVAYFLSSDDVQRQFRLSTDNGTKAGMNLITVQSTPLLLPALLEQQRIASFLFSVDSQISAEAQKLEVLKTHRKGLMQRLFPLPEEV